jgi:hypothetical protein
VEVNSNICTRQLGGMIFADNNFVILMIFTDGKADHTTMIESYDLIIRTKTNILKGVTTLQQVVFRKSLRNER